MRIDLLDICKDLKQRNDPEWLADFIKNNLMINFDAYQNNFTAANLNSEGVEVKLVSKLDENEVFTKPLADLLNVELARYNKAYIKHKKSKFEKDY